MIDASTPRPARLRLPFRWRVAFAAGLLALIATVVWFAHALGNQSRIEQQIANLAGDHPRPAVPGLIESVIAQIDAAPGERPSFFNEVSDLWFLARLQNASDEDFLAGLGASIPRYLTAYDYQFAKQAEGMTTRGDRVVPLVNANDHFIRGLLRAVVPEAGGVLRATQDLDLALALAPDHDSALATRGRLRRVAGDLAGAERDLRESLRVNPQRWSVWQELARTLTAAGRLAEAQAAREEARARAPESKQAQMGRE
ncbi:MAG: tetratricopeptide repeat protein [Planctomycetota bacterium]